MSQVDQLRKRIAIAGFARQFSQMVKVGIQLVDCLRVLEDNAEDSALRDAIRKVRSLLDTGQTLSQAMGAEPEWFPPAARYLVRAGEVGGVLDDTLDAWADLLDRDLELHQRFQTFRLLARMPGASCGSGEADLEQRIEAALANLRPRIEAALFLFGLGVMVGAGVPLPRALGEAACALEEPASGMVSAVAEDLLWKEDLRLHQRLKDMPGMTPLTLELLRIGEEFVMLDTMAQRAAELLRTECEREVWLASEQWLSAE